MKFLATVILIASSAVCNAGETHNCDDLVGWWQGERFEYEVGENVSETSVFLPNGEFFVQFDMDDGINKRTQYESGRWQCDGDKLIIATTSVNQQSILNVAIFEYCLYQSRAGKHRLQHGLWTMRRCRSRGD